MYIECICIHMGAHNIHNVEWCSCAPMRTGYFIRYRFFVNLVAALHASPLFCVSHNETTTTTTTTTTSTAEV